MSRRPETPGRREERRPRDAEATRAAILAAARDAFAAGGLAGARMDAIAEAARINKAMLYYYFGDKDGLFQAVLEELYAELCAVGPAPGDERGDPLAALDRVVDGVWSYYRSHPEAIALLNSANRLGARHLVGSAVVERLKPAFIGRIDSLLRRGAEAGVFRPGIDPVDLHITIVAMAYYYLGNNGTLSLFFGRDLATTDAAAHWGRHMRATVRALVGAVANGGAEEGGAAG